MSAVGESLAGFRTLCDEVFKGPLATHGFEPVDRPLLDAGPHPTGSERTYVCGSRYVHVSASTDFRDGAHVAVTLGDGSYEWPETDWNSIGLAALTGRRRGGWWAFDSVSEVPDVLARARRELEEHATDFLSADLRRFSKARARQNRKRKPYMIYEPDARGRYRGGVDAESAALKERYSREDP